MELVQTKAAGPKKSTIHQAMAEPMAETGIHVLLMITLIQMFATGSPGRKCM